jgi:hypothetical protein
MLQLHLTLPALSLKYSQYGNRQAIGHNGIKPLAWLI